MRPQRRVHPAPVGERHEDHVGRHGRPAERIDADGGRNRIQHGSVPGPHGRLTHALGTRGRLRIGQVEGVRRHAIEHYLDLVRAGRVDVTPILTHRFPLDDYKDAFRATHTQGETGAVKVLFDFRD